MFNPSDSRAILLGALLMPLTALAGVSAVETGVVRGAPAETMAAPKREATSGYQLRCWQFGRLLFEEHLATLPPNGTRYAIRLSGTDRQGRPVYVAEVDSATCLIRSAYEGPRDKRSP